MRKPCWLITVPGYPSFSMVSEPMTHGQALAVAQAIWPFAEVK